MAEGPKGPLFSKVLAHSALFDWASSVGVSPYSSALPGLANVQSKSEAKTTSKATAVQVAALKQLLVLRETRALEYFFQEKLSLSIILLKICRQLKWMVYAQHNFQQFCSSA